MFQIFGHSQCSRLAGEQQFLERETVSGGKSDKSVICSRMFDNQSDQNETENLINSPFNQADQL